jgi:lipid-binding SYLF domain-containing protein
MNLLPRIAQPAVLLIAAAALAACSSSSSSSATTETTAAKVDSERADLYKRLDDSTQLAKDLRSKIPDSVAVRAQCVVIVPSLVKAGLVVGGEGGSGYATCQTANGWSGPAPISIGGGTLGAQIGVQSTEVVAVVTSMKGMQALASGNFRVGVDASASAGPVGTGRGTATDMPSSTDVVSYSRAKGLFAGANLSGSTIKADDDAIRAIYGAPHGLVDILGGKVPPPNAPATDRFLSTMRASYGKGAASSVSLL